MVCLTVMVHGRVVPKRSSKMRAKMDTGGGKALVYLTQLMTGRRVKPETFGRYDAVRYVDA